MSKNKFLLVTLICIIGVILILGKTYIGEASSPIILFIQNRIVNSNPPPMLINDRVFVPLRFVAENLDCDVEYIEGANMVKIYRKPVYASYFVENPILLTEEQFRQQVVVPVANSLLAYAEAQKRGNVTAEDYYKYKYLFAKNAALLYSIRPPAGYGAIHFKLMLVNNSFLFHASLGLYEQMVGTASRVSLSSLKSLTEDLMEEELRFLVLGSI